MKNKWQSKAELVFKVRESDKEKLGILQCHLIRFLSPMKTKETLATRSRVGTPSDQFVKSSKLFLLIYLYH